MEDMHHFLDVVIMMIVIIITEEDREVGLVLEIIVGEDVLEVVVGGVIQLHQVIIMMIIIVMKRDMVVHVPILQLDFNIEMIFERDQVMVED
jgi:hypothetical protein